MPWSTGALLTQYHQIPAGIWKNINLQIFSQLDDILIHIRGRVWPGLPVIFVSILEKNPETKNILQNPGAWFSRQIPCLRWCYISCYIVRHRLAGCVIGQRYAFSHKKINKNFLEGKRPSKSGETSGKVEHVGNHQLEENVYSFVITDNVKIVYMGLLS